MKNASGRYPIQLNINDFDGYGGNWTQANKEPDPFGFGIGISQEIYSSESNKSPEEIFNEITSTGQEAIMIAISTVYYKN